MADPAIDPQQEVGIAEPAAVEEGRLEDDFGARGHGTDRVLRLPADAVAALGLVIASDLDDGSALRAQVGEVASLVLEPATADDVELAVLSHRLLDEAGQRGALEAVRCSQAR